MLEVMKKKEQCWVQKKWSEKSLKKRKMYIKKEEKHIIGINVWWRGFESDKSLKRIHKT